VSLKTVYDHVRELLFSLAEYRQSLNERRRLILFIVHSLGGIILKEALRYSKALRPADAHISAIFESTAGIIFFGTPHREADLVGLVRCVIEITAKCMGVKVNEQIVNTLMPDAGKLTELRDEFGTMCHQGRWRVYSFQEEYGVSLLRNRKVVDNFSSCLDDALIETRRHVSKNHMDMCRFYGMDDPEYGKVEAAIRLILQSHGGQVGMVSPRLPRVHDESREDDNSAIKIDSESPTPNPVRNRVQGAAPTAGALTLPQDRVTRASNGIDPALKQILIDSLYFDKIDERLTSLTPAQGKTCRWFLTKPEFAR
jgi:hypothetical protein